MMFGFMRVRTHDAEMAKVRAEAKEAEAAVDKVAVMYRRKWNEAVTQASQYRDERDTLQSRLDALTPARGEGGRFVGKAVSNG